MILVLGAAGKTGQAVVRALVRSGRKPSALVRTVEQLNRVIALGAWSVMTGDLAEPESLARAMRGVQTVYAIFPNVHPDEVGLARKAIAAAKRAGVERLVYHSVLHPQTEDMPHHLQKLRAEDMLRQSGLAYTVLQPAAYMQNVLAHRTAILRDRRHPVPYALGTRLGLVDLVDVADVAAKVLTESGHAGACYELAGPEVLDQNDVARVLCKATKRDVRAVVVPRADWERSARENGMGEYQVGALLKMFEYYERYGFWGNPAVLTALLGRKPTTFAEFCKREFPDYLVRR